MHIFLSWSGERSRLVAEVLRGWLPAVIQAARPYFSPDDIQKGARWNAEIAKELEQSKVGIICVTAQNLTAPWLMFEAGALAKSLDRTRVVPLLIDLESSDLSGPLSQFQASRFDQSDVKKIICVVNDQLGDAALEDSVLDTVFEKWWPDLQQKISAALDASNVQGELPSRRDRDVLDEILGLVREMTFGTGASQGIIARAIAAAASRKLSMSDPIDFLSLTARSATLLKGDGVLTIGDAVEKSEEDLIKLPNIGRKTLNELRECLAEHGLQLRADAL